MKNLIRRLSSSVLITGAVFALLFGGDVGGGVGVLALIGGLIAYA